MNCQKQHYNIAIFEEEIVLTDHTGDAPASYIITPEQLGGFVRTATTFRPYPGLVWMKADGQTETHLITLPAAERVILYRPLTKTKKKGVKPGKLTDHRLKLPALAIKATISATDRNITGIEIWGMSSRTLTAKTRLYDLPLPNLNGSHLCLGSTERAAGADIRAAIERTIFDTPFNHHNNIVGREKIPFTDYLRKYTGTAPLRTLIQIGTGDRILEARP